VKFSYENQDRIGIRSAEFGSTYEELYSHLLKEIKEEFKAKHSVIAPAKKIQIPILECLIMSVHDIKLLHLVQTQWYGIRFNSYCCGSNHAA